MDSLEQKWLPFIQIEKCKSRFKAQVNKRQN